MQKNLWTGARTEKGSFSRMLFRWFFTLVLMLGCMGGLAARAVHLDENIVAGRAGRYILTTGVRTVYNPEGLRGMLQVPTTVEVEDKRRLIVYFHGMTQKVDSFQVDVAELASWAEEHNYYLLSMQNEWGMDINQIDVRLAMELSSEAARDIVQALEDSKVVLPANVYVVGHSAGGMAALCTILEAPQLFGGLGHLKGNFYDTVVEPIYYYALEHWPKEAGEYPEFLLRLRLFMVLGGPKEGGTIKEQSPQAYEFLRSRVGYIYFKKYPEEGHPLTLKNLNDLSAFIEEKSNIAGSLETAGRSP